MRLRGWGLPQEVIAPLNHNDKYGDEQGVNNECLDQHESQKDQEPDVGRGGGIAGNAFTGTAYGLRLTQGPGSSRQRDDRPADNDRQLEQRARLGVEGSFRFLSEQRHAHQDKKKKN